MSPATKFSSRFGLLAYALANLALFILKLAHVPPVAAWSWWWVTGLLWLPWVITLGFAGLGLLVRIVKGGPRV